jgi:hypothetical protein
LRINGKKSEVEGKKKEGEGKEEGVGGPGNIMGRKMIGE